MIYCPDCELVFDENDIEDSQVDDDGTVWCGCGSRMNSFDCEVNNARTEVDQAG